MVSITLRVLSRPDVKHLPKIYQNLGMDYDERVLPSIGNEVLKSIVAQFDAAELITQREVVCRENWMEVARETNKNYISSFFDRFHQGFERTCCNVQESLTFNLKMCRLHTWRLERNLRRLSRRNKLHNKVCIIIIVIIFLKEMFNDMLQMLNGPSLLLKKRNKNGKRLLSGRREKRRLQRRSRVRLLKLGMHLLRSRRLRRAVQLHNRWQVIRMWRIFRVRVGMCCWMSPQNSYSLVII